MGKAGLAVTKGRTFVRRWFGGTGTGSSTPGGVRTTVAAALAVLAVGVGAVVVGTPISGEVVDLLSGRGWLTDSDEGVVMLANGSSARVDLRFKVDGVAGHDIEVVQIDGKAHLVDHTDGTIRLLDVADLKVGEAQSLGDPEGLDVVPAGDKLILVRRVAGVVEVKDPGTGKSLAKTDVGGRLTRAVVDGDDQVWVADTEAGAAIPLRFDGDRFEVGEGVHVGRGSAMNLALVDGLPVTIDPERKELTRVEDGKAGDPVDLPLEDEESPLIARVTAGALASLAVNESGHLVVVEGARTNRVSLGRSGHDLGEPVVFSRRVYVPDFTTGEVLVLDDRGSPAGPSVRVGGGAGRFSLKVEGGHLWIDDPTSDDAFVLSPRDQGFRRVDKGTQDVPSSEAPRPVLAAPAPPPTSAPPPSSPGNAGSTPGPEQRGSRPGGGPGPGQGGSTGAGPDAAQTPTGAPGAPGSPTATAGDREAVVSWASAPANGAAIDNYEISWSPTATSRGGEAGSRSVRGSTLRATIDGLRNGATYTFSITATNSAGTGPAATTPAVTPDGNVPTAPTDVTASGGADGSIDVSWSEADPNGASPIASYTVVATDGTGIQTEVATSVTGTSATVGVATGLTLGGTYSFTVAASNERGVESTPSGASDPRVLASPADAPTAVTASQGDGTSTVTWAAPALNGGALVHYEVIASGDAGTQTVTDPTATFTGLQNGTDYSFSVHAVTEANGETLAGAAGSATARPGRPPALSAMSASASGTTVTWSFGVSDDVIGDAVCTVNANGNPVRAEAACGSMLSGSFNGAYATTYTVTARARNAYGQSNTVSASARTANPPPPPPAITIARGGPAPAGSWYSVTLSRFPAGSQVTVTCRDSVDPGGFWTQTFTIDAAGNAGDSTLCYSADGPDHWVTGGGRESNHVSW